MEDLQQKVNDSIHLVQNDSHIYIMIDQFHICRSQIQCKRDSCQLIHTINKCNVIYCRTRQTAYKYSKPHVFPFSAVAIIFIAILQSKRGPDIQNQLIQASSFRYTVQQIWREKNGEPQHGMHIIVKWIVKLGSKMHLIRKNKGTENEDDAELTFKVIIDIKQLLSQLCYTEFYDGHCFASLLHGAGVYFCPRIHLGPNMVHHKSNCHNINGTCIHPSNYIKKLSFPVLTLDQLLFFHQNLPVVSDKIKDYITKSKNSMTVSNNPIKLKSGTRELHKPWKDAFKFKISDDSSAGYYKQITRILNYMDNLSVQNLEIGNMHKAFQFTIEVKGNFHWLLDGMHRRILIWNVRHSHGKYGIKLQIKCTALDTNNDTAKYTVVLYNCSINMVPDDARNKIQYLFNNNNPCWNTKISRGRCYEIFHPEPNAYVTFIMDYGNIMDLQQQIQRDLNIDLEHIIVPVEHQENKSNPWMPFHSILLNLLAKSDNIEISPIPSPPAITLDQIRCQYGTRLVSTYPNGKKTISLITGNGTLQNASPTYHFNPVYPSGFMKHENQIIGSQNNNYNNRGDLRQIIGSQNNNYNNNNQYHKRHYNHQTQRHCNRPSPPPYQPKMHRNPPRSPPPPTTTKHTNPPTTPPPKTTQPHYSNRHRNPPRSPSLPPLPPLPPPQPKPMHMQQLNIAPVSDAASNRFPQHHHVNNQPKKPSYNYPYDDDEKRHYNNNIGKIQNDNNNKHIDTDTSQCPMDNCHFLCSTANKEEEMDRHFNQCHSDMKPKSNNNDNNALKRECLTIPIAKVTVQKECIAEGSYGRIRPANIEGEERNFVVKEPHPKVLRPGAMNDSDYMHPEETHLREKNLWLLVPKHPSLLQLRGEVWNPPHYYLISKRYHTNLGAYLWGNYRNRTITTEHEISIVHQLLLGVEALHINNIIHRDLKPENILITAYKDKHGTGSIEYKVKITDFGAITIKNEKDVYCLWGAGTPKYSPPEVLIKAKGSEYQNEYWDMYSLGMIIFELKIRGDALSQFDGGKDQFYDYYNNFKCDTLICLVQNGCRPYIGELNSNKFTYKYWFGAWKDIITKMWNKQALIDKVLLWLDKQRFPEKYAPDR